MSRVYLVRIAVYTFAFLSAFSQTRNQQDDVRQASEAEVRQVVDTFLKAVREGKNAQVRELLSENARFFNAGGTEGDTAALMELLGKTAPVFGINRASLVRHIQFLSPDIALAYGLTRNPKVNPPSDSATFMIALVRKQGRWKIEARHDAQIQSPDSVVIGPADTISSDGILTPEEFARGWRPLFDGKSTSGWTSMDGGPFPSSWRIENGTLRTVVLGSGRNDVRTKERFTSFELDFEWRVNKDANSGVKYRLFGIYGRGPSAAGYEYQIADDDGDRGARVDPKQRSGALYGVLPVRQKAAKPIGEWNQSKLIVANDHIEHWLNGVKTAEQAIDIPLASPIVLQHHTSEVGFRNLKIRPIANR